MANSEMSVGEMLGSVAEFMAEINKLVTTHKIEGVGVMLKRPDGLCRVFQFGLDEDDLKATAEAFHEFSEGFFAN